jgi:hypothetical protein
MKEKEDGSSLFLAHVSIFSKGRGKRGTLNNEYGGKISGQIFTLDI